MILKNRKNVKFCIRSFGIGIKKEDISYRYDIHDFASLFLPVFLLESIYDVGNAPISVSFEAAIENNLKGKLMKRTEIKLAPNSFQMFFGYFPRLLTRLVDFSFPCALQGALNCNSLVSYISFRVSSSVAGTNVEKLNSMLSRNVGKNRDDSGWCQPHK